MTLRFNIKTQAFLKPSNNKPILIIANSGRMLAETACRAGFKPWVVDLFADQDTRQLSEQTFRVESLAPSFLETIVADFKSRHANSPVTYGSGLEHHPESLEMIGRECELLGNDIETVLQLHPKKRFFECLDRLKIQYPYVVFAEPATCERWLIKPETGEGGLNIRWFHTGIPIEPDTYWQKYIEGTTCSALFLADGRNFQTIGFHTQWSENLDTDKPFLFAGVINRSPLSSEQKLRVHSWIGSIMQQIPLKGLNTIDFIVKDGQIYMLELNPRPSASMQLYDGDLFKAHINACRGILDDTKFANDPVCAYRILYADQKIAIPENFCWPKACRDLPIAGSIIRKGQPICSIIARDINVRNVHRQLNEVRQTIIQSFN
uniref:Conserved protein n=1 Tax=Methylotuvimicrobium kenyense TaxID=269709 RepID=Q6R3H3_9GAMM|nr:conserved protein [Methylotuvimicrobium kenyense]